MITEKLVVKTAHRIPALIVRAIAGDATAIAILAAMGITVAAEAIKSSNKPK